MEHTLLIHIGISKTGTSALQTFLYENMEKLEEYGWRYPDLNKELFGLQFLTFGKEINGSVFYKEREKLDTEAENWNKAWERVLEHLKTKNVIISDERICVWDTNKFLTAAKEKYDNIKVIIYLRRQDRAIESFWNQRVKNPVGCGQIFQEFIHFDGCAECAPYHYKRQLDDISNIVGKENLIVRVYEKGQLCGEKHNTESDFLSSIGIEPDWDQWKKCVPQNLRLGENYLEIKRIFNSILDEGDVEQGISSMLCFEKLSQNFCCEEKEKGCFTIEEREKFLKQFEAENEEIAREYLHRNDGILFYDDRKDYPLYEYSYTSFEQDMIRVFSALINNQSRELQRLEKHNSFLAEKLMLFNNSNGKRLLLFGAGHKCRKLLDELRTPVTLIVDNDETKSGKSLQKVPIVFTEQVKDWSDYFIIVTCAETEEIEQQLQGFGLEKEKDYVVAKDYFIYY
ncbi:MAG: hypothetical protein HFI19_07295 [Lachnospiraceae bacterium]|uniref:nucleoside-diphosphate sugar epimerase/dehydratase n=1 Tax=Candidatus Merdisoma sp. JLR.KK006 TaxID=3112626 RepID=UPI002FF40CEA|nr:hypothetical protein [Lachnospiraceae bacterium]